MPKTKTDKRSRLIQTAVKLAYRHGFRTTSLADIAEAAKVPVGNVYYYFKTKDEIGEAIVHQGLYRSSDVTYLASARVLDIKVAEMLSVSSAASKVRFKDEVALLSKIQGPRAEAQNHLTFRASVCPDD